MVFTRYLKLCTSTQDRAKRAANPEAEREKERAYVAANRERVKERKRSHQRAHPEKHLEAGRRYRETHRKESNAKARARRNANLEYYRAIGRNSYERHRKERAAYSREYLRRNRDKALATLHRRRARKYKAEGSHTIEEWEALKRHCDFTCLCCRRYEPEIVLTRDHVIPLEKGGSNWISNIQPLCVHCNSKKNTRVIDYRK